MSGPNRVERGRRRGPRGAILSRDQGFRAASVALVLVFVSAGAPIPVMGIYRDAGVTNAQMAVASVGYFVSAAVGLLVLGRLSTHVGRRRAGAIALLAAAVGVMLLLVVNGPVSLVAARALQGLACGVAPGALGAYVVDLADRRRWLPAIITGSAPMIGLPLGALLTGAAVEVESGAAASVFLFLAVALVLATVAVVLAPETVAPRAGARASLVPRVLVPRALRRPTAAVAFVFVATWPLGGFYQAFGSVVADDVLGSTGALAAGAMFASIMVLNPVGGALSARLPARLGAMSAMLGYAILLAAAGAALWGGRSDVFVVASLLGGVLQGIAATSAMRLLIPLTRIADRAEVLTAIFATAYGSVAIAGLGAAFLASSLPLESVAMVYVGLGVLAALVASALPTAAPASEAVPTPDITTTTERTHP
ncbi:MAG: MFS transporter [Aeromicrobium sp.]|uniref:MFS transporter n=1 Tax=Aeromicrobium sp. TaxID=1871063 RepID=UPI002605CA76|nr:MFS transporter [Aeromicrobium sp.]MDF1704900.1 MFS transporter [Aeromicrobium sp.]